MAHYREWWHVKFDCRYHIVWVTKFRRKWINKDLEKVIEAVVKEVCTEQYVNLIRVWMENNHIHLYVSIAPSRDIPKIIQLFKWRSSRILWELNEYKDYFKKIYRKEWVGKRAVWYFICTVWEVNDKLIREYIESQWEQEETESPKACEAITMSKWTQQL